ncbi:MAG: trimethylamine methyltransferase family protein [Alphaproteobacteria bacterium]|nr:trimethylamine methyltransferase family protein [Alphaproteobacteria bacterium]
MARDNVRRRERRTTRGPQQLAWRAIENPYKPIEVLSDDQVEAIHTASLRVLRDLGMEFLGDQALDLLLKAGATVDRATRRVRFDPAMIMEHVAKAPKRFTLHARNPAHDLAIGGRSAVFSAVASAPNCSDMDKGRRPGSHEDYKNLLRLAQSLNIVHLCAGYPVEPIDLPAPTRHLDCYYGYIALTDKVWHPYSLGRQRIVDALAMDRIARGIDEQAQIERPALITIVNTNSPLRLDTPMIEGLFEMAAHGQVVCVTPFTLSGAMAPVTLAGALVQQNAEALAAIALCQMVRPGAPVMEGGFTSNVDMKSGAPAFGTPEYARAALAGGQLARRYGIPYRSSNANACTIVDAQAAYDSEMSVWSAVMGHANLVMHAAGWMEGGLVASFEKMIVDAEILQMMAEFLRPIEVTEATMGIDAMAEVGPGGHYFGAQHTLERYETAFYSPILSDWRNFETWRQDGAKTAFDRANAIYKELLANYAPPPLDPATDAALKDYIARRKAEPIAA